MRTTATLWRAKRFASSSSSSSSHNPYTYGQLQKLLTSFFSHDPLYGIFSISHFTSSSILCFFSIAINF